MRKFLPGTGKAALLTIFWVCLAASAGDVVGSLVLSDHRGGTEPIEPQTIVIYLDKFENPIPAAVKDRTYRMVTENKQFLPRLLVVPVGAEVNFPNFDPIIHNAFSVSGKNRFDAGRFAKGEGATHRFEYPGLVRVYCNVHHQMNAIILVSPNPYFAEVEPSGNFRLRGVPEGNYELQALHYNGSRLRETIAVPARGDLKLDLQMEMRKVRPKPHMDKHGKPYRRTRSRRY